MQYPKIAIIDYGVGNLYSLRKACVKFSKNTMVTDDPAVIKSADAVILPGVGAFKSGMEGLKQRGLVKAIKEFAASGKPMLGICLGAQLMLDRGYEFGKFDGLGLIPGEVVIFPKLKNAKIPQIGWNTIKTRDPEKLRNGASRRQGTRDKKFVFHGKTILDSIKDGPHFYFVHSYFLKPKKRNHILTETNYGGYKFCSAIKSGNIYGTQFHPEKSGQVGLKIIENFIKLAK